jgi:hypothetical protein
MSSYSFVISTSFPNHKVDTSRLAKEVQDSTIAIVLDRIDTSGDLCELVFKAALSSEEQSTLAALVAAHSGASMAPPPAQVALSVPMTSDGKPIFQPSMFPGGVFLYVTGAGDTTVRGNGQAFAVESEAAGEVATEFNFKDWVYLASGGLMWQGAQFGDWVNFEFYAPATVVTPNGTQTGNCNLVDPGIGAAILIVPANGDGSYDVDLSQAKPVPAYGADGASNGYWEWTEPDVGSGAVSVSPSPGAGGWHLYAAAIPLVKFINRLHLLGAGAMDMNPPAIKSKKMLPHWKGKVTLHNEGHTGLKVAWYLATARVQTT